MTKINWPNRQIQQLNPKIQASDTNNRGSVKTGFEDLLYREIGKTTEPVKLSAHAEKRLRERNIELSPEDLKAINSAVQKVAAKGGKESLLIYGDLALVTSIRNKTVVTAMENRDMKEHVFTNIDSAVFVK